MIIWALLFRCRVQAHERHTIWAKGRSATEACESTYYIHVYRYVYMFMYINLYIHTDMYVYV